MNAPLLEVRHLRTTFRTDRGPLDAVRDVSFSLAAGRTLGLVGESGSGKSVTGFSIMGLIDPPGRITAGDVLFQGSVGRTDLPLGSHEQLLRSIEKNLLPLPDDTIFICGHGPMSTIGRERATNPFLQ